MNRGSRVRIEYRRGDGYASCRDCQIAPDVTRERLRQHVAATGHTASYVVERITVYWPKHRPEEDTDRA